MPPVPRRCASFLGGGTVFWILKRGVWEFVGASCVREGPLCCDGGAGAVKDFPPYYCGVFLSVGLGKQEGARGISAYFGSGGTALLSIYSSGRWPSGIFLCRWGRTDSALPQPSIVDYAPLHIRGRAFRERCLRCRYSSSSRIKRVWGGLGGAAFSQRREKKRSYRAFHL